METGKDWVNDRPWNKQPWAQDGGENKTVMTIGAGSLGTSTEQAAGRVGSDGGDVDGQGRPVFWPPAIQ